ncbi:MAG: thiol-disulfide isomerase/thioredoxin [Verrucomicrobiales bacterium]|jgi:thiol-disulfide isomerase/thioredoxin
MAARLIAGLVLLACVAVLGAVAFGDSDEAPEVATTTTTTAALAEAPDNYGPRKSLVNLDGWLNTDIDSLDDLDGKVVLVEMWTFGCSNCKARIPHTQALYADLSRDDFEIVGVHAPEFSYEAEIPNIEQAVVDLGVTWPVALDTSKENFRSWQDGGRRFWPRTYVIDQHGDVRYDHIGEGRYEELEQTINFLIDNPPVTATS